MKTDAQPLNRPVEVGISHSKVREWLGVGESIYRLDKRTLTALRDMGELAPEDWDVETYARGISLRSYQTYVLFRQLVRNRGRKAAILNIGPIIKESQNHERQGIA